MKNKAFSKALNSAIFRTNFCAFSLIELLITLIIISLLIAAFTPLITKKLKASDITVGSFNSSSNIELENNAPKSQADCDKFGALFIPASMNDGTNNVCVTKYNMGDNGLPLAAGTQVINVGQTCTNDGNCCWKGQTAAAYTSGKNGDSSYSGQNRTVCLFAPAQNACNRYAPSGTRAGDWRLPTEAESKGWINNINSINNGQGKKGLQLCSHSDVNGVDKCSYLKNCPSSSTSFITNWGCHPYDVKIMPDEGKINTYTYIIFSDVEGGPVRLLDDNGQGDFAGTVRCVYDGLSSYNIVQKPVEKEPETEYREPQSQADCEPFHAMFIHRYFNGPDGKNLCVTKRNMLDDSLHTVPSGVTVVNASSNCTSKKCCWKGQTANASTCTTAYMGSYSGCNRTVCNYDAGKALCEGWAPAGTKAGWWRLPTYNELTGWSANINVVSDNLGEDGLELCINASMQSDISILRGKAGICVMTWDNRCAGAYDGQCRPRVIYGGANDKGTISSLDYLADGSIVGIVARLEETGKSAYSIRCVTDKILK